MLSLRLCRYYLWTTTQRIANNSLISTHNSVRRPLTSIIFDHNRKFVYSPTTITADQRRNCSNDHDQHQRLVRKFRWLLFCFGIVWTNVYMIVPFVSAIETYILPEITWQQFVDQMHLPNKIDRIQYPIMDHCRFVIVYLLPNTKIGDKTMPIRVRLPVDSYESFIEQLDPIQRLDDRLLLTSAWYGQVNTLVYTLIFPGCIASLIVLMFAVK